MQQTNIHKRRQRRSGLAVVEARHSCFPHDQHSTARKKCCIKRQIRCTRNIVTNNAEELLAANKLRRSLSSNSKSPSHELGLWLTKDPFSPNLAPPPSAPLIVETPNKGTFVDFVGVVVIYFPLRLIYRFFQAKSLAHWISLALDRKLCPRQRQCVVTRRPFSQMGRLWLTLWPMQHLETTRAYSRYQWLSSPLLNISWPWPIVCIWNPLKPPLPV